jgi:hypothetical protein
MRSKRRGDQLRAFAAALFDARTMERVIDPAIADLQSQGNELVGSYFGVVKAIALCATGGVMLAPSSWPADDRRAFGRTLIWSSALVVILTALFEYPVAARVPVVLLHPSPLRYLYLAPPALTITLTMGATLGVVFALGGRQLSRRMTYAVLALSLAASIVSLVNVAWVTPVSNQAFRVLMSGTLDRVPDLPEMTLADVAQTLRELRRNAPLANNGYTAALAFNYHVRWAIGLSPIVYALFALSLFDTVRRRWLVAVIACGSFMAYDGLLYFLRPWNSGLPTILAAWSTNLLLLGVAGAATFINVRRSKVSLIA